MKGKSCTVKSEFAKQEYIFPTVRAKIVGKFLYFPKKTQNRNAKQLDGNSLIAYNEIAKRNRTIRAKNGTDRQYIKECGK